MNIKNIITTFLILLTIQQLSYGQTTGPEGINANIKLWLDASEQSTVLNSSGSTVTEGERVQTWQDISGNAAHVTQSSVNQQPIWDSTHTDFNKKACLDFDNTDWLRHASSKSDWTDEFTLFIILYSDATSPVLYESFFSNDNNPINSAFQVDYQSSGDKFRFKTGAGSAGTEGYFGNFEAQKLKLYAANHTGDSILLRDDQNLVDTIATTNGKNFDEYRINRNRVGNKSHDSKIAEVIIYDRSLTDCETETILKYLGAKYGKDFIGSTGGYDYTPNFEYNINAIGTVPTNCTSGTIDSAQSSILTIHNAVSNDSLNEFMILGHDGDSVTLGTIDVPAGLHHRIRRTWRFDEDGDLGKIDLSFDLTQIVDSTGTNISTGQFFLIRSSVNTFASGNTLSSTYTVSGNIITFTNIDILDGDFISLGADSIRYLPIDFKSFSVTQDRPKTASLNWETSSENNNDFFTVLRSIDGEHWSEVAEIDGALNSSTLLAYSFTDNIPKADRYFYKIKQTDLDGKTSFSEIRTVETYIETSFTVYPNPTQGVLNIITSQVKNQPSIIEVIDLYGSSIMKKELNSYDSYISINVSELNNGIYIISIISDKNKVSKRFIKE